ncbi:MAG: site-specific integrase, partial [Treponema sp.]|nr:site-specific integrase [Treponema sp.]
MCVSDAVEEFLLYLGSVRGFSENTVLSYRNDLAQFMQMPHIGAQTDIGAV